MLAVQIGRGHSFLPSQILAVVDSGSPYCLFHSSVAEALKMGDLTTGKPSEIGGINQAQGDTYYFHRVKLKIERNWLIEVMAGFSSKMSVRAILGRNGFFDQFYVTFDHSGNPPVLDITKVDRVQ